MNRILPLFLGSSKFWWSWYSDINSRSTKYWFIWQINCCLKYCVEWNVS